MRPHSMTIPTEERGIAHTQEGHRRERERDGGGRGQAGMVAMIDLHLPAGREGGCPVEGGRRGEASVNLALERDRHLAPLVTVLAGRPPRTRCGIRLCVLERSRGASFPSTFRAEQGRFHPFSEIRPIGMAPHNLAGSALAGALVPAPLHGLRVTHSIPGVGRAPWI